MNKLIYSSTIVLCIFFTACSIAWVKKHGFHRPYFSSDIAALAQHLAEKKLPADRCLDLVWWDIGMQAGEAKAECIFDYARLTKNPSACELLMPSSYGWDCLGAATDHRLCIIGEGPEYTVRGQGKVTTYNECLSGDQEIRNYSCCVMARILTQENAQDQCESLATPALQDECHYFLARKTVRNVECANIINPTTRTACEVAVRALNPRTL